MRQCVRNAKRFTDRGVVYRVLHTGGQAAELLWLLLLECGGLTPLFFDLESVE